MAKVTRPPRPKATDKVDLSSYQITSLRGGDPELYRAEHGNGGSLLMVVQRRSSERALKRLASELSLRKDLDPAWAARPIGQSSYEGCPALLLEDPGGQALSRLIGQPLGIGQFLAVAIALADALQRVHDQSIIHRDVKPANLLVDGDLQRAWFTGFGLASRLVREDLALDPPDVIAGTLAYMAPEQTGRMNRPCDSRSDLYALGVTLYELLTGILPFTSADPAELIHCHIAREPAPPSVHAPGTPEPLSTIIMKLLAKPAEDRYQTAAGLAADLRKCLAAYTDTGRVDPFVLGASDAADRLLIPDDIYGREAQVASLLAAFDRVAAVGRPELVLVSGAAGIGKSSVVEGLHKVITLPRGFFISGKSDQRLRNVPYSAIAQALQGLVRLILKGEQGEIRRWREQIIAAVSPHGRLLTDLIPEIAPLIGPHPAVPELPPLDAELRFQSVLQRLIAVFAQPQHPLVLFVDDVQWMDTATLARIEYILGRSDGGSLLVVAAFRDNEVPLDHPLRQTVDRLQRSGVRVEELALRPISASDIGQMIANALHCDPPRARQLATVIHNRTGGNPLFASQFLRNLEEEGLVRFDAGTKHWIWDAKTIEAKRFNDNILDMVTERLRRLPPQARQALEMMACLGPSSDVSTLRVILDLTEPEVHERLRVVVESGSIVARGATYRFLHDRVQEAAYALIPQETRPRLHQRIGLRLLADRTETEVDEHIFDIVNQLNLGVSPSSASDDLSRVVRLNLQAGLRAKATADYASACGFFTFGLSVAGEKAWDNAYEIAFRLLLGRAECDLLGGNLVVLQQSIDDLLLRARSRMDRAEALKLKVTLHLLNSHVEMAVRTALECLKMFDVTFIADPSAEDVMRAYQAVAPQLSEQALPAFIDLPPMINPEMRLVSSVIETLGLSAYYTNHALCDLLNMRNIRLALDHGHSEASVLGLAGLGISLGPEFGLYAEGERLARAAVAICERHGFRVERTGAYLQLQMAILWTRPISDALQCLDAAELAATESGEVVYACYCAEHRITNLLVRGDPLDLVRSELAKAQHFVRERGYAHVADSLDAIEDLVRTLRIDGPRDARLTSPLVGRAPSDIPVLRFFYWVLQLQSRYLMGDIAGAFAAAKIAKGDFGPTRRHIQAGTFTFYYALVLAAVIRSGADEDTSALRVELEALLGRLAGFAAAGPHTFDHKRLLVAAELAGLNGPNPDAMRLYDQAVRSAAENGFVHEAALGAERAADFFATCGLERVAHVYRVEAREAYRMWGALAKVAQLEARHPEVALSGPDTYAPSIETSLDHLDMAAVIRTSRVVAQELVIDRLIETLMTIAIEHAGADRGLLVRADGDGFVIEAEARSRGHKISVHLVDKPAAALDLPLSILAKVRETQAATMLVDARVDLDGAADPYLGYAGARSVFCLPLLKQRELIGILYLENRRASHVFTPARTELLKLLSAQAAISLQNARLFADLVRENRERQRAEAALRSAQAELAHVARITTVGELIASIAHEINQPLAAIAMNGRASANWLDRTPPNVERAREALGQIVEDVDRTGEVMRSLRSLVTKSDPKREWCDLKAIILEVLALAHTELEKQNVTTTLHLSEGAPSILGDRVQLQQVVLNLVVNGVEAMSAVADGPRTLTLTCQAEPEGALRVSVADTGPGIDPDTADKVFDSFFTTKATGMGMGLSICRSIIVAHGGAIRVSAKAPHGAIFEFCLPVDDFQCDFNQPLTSRAS